MGPIMLSAGGTGGHVFPARALAAELSSRGRSLALVTDPRGGDYERLFAGIPIYPVRAGTPSGRGAIGKIGALLSIVIGTLQAHRVRRRLRPAAVVGFGGYPSLPGMLACLMSSVPTILHEQNAVLGRVNRLLASRVRAIATSFEQTRGLPNSGGVRVVVTGNPVRPDVAAIGATDYRPPSLDEPFQLLVFGGSQGASVFADVVPAAVKALPEAMRQRLRITQQCRPGERSAVEGIYGDLNVTAAVSDFFDDLPQRLAAAHLVIARAGAGTVSELAAAGRPAILVPYPHAMDDHQRFNAMGLTSAGGAIAFAQTDFDAVALADVLGDLIGAPGRLVAMAQRAREVGVPNAAAKLADLVEALADGAVQNRQLAEGVAS